MSAPENLLYSKTHEWAKIEGNEAVVGISFFAQSSLGDITYVELPAEGDSVTLGKEFGSIESVKAASDLVSPVSGKVIAVNNDLENAPETCNKDPYGAGWIMKVELSSKPEGLLNASAYTDFCATEKH